MSNIYENVPKFESEKFSLRFVDKADVDDLLEVYSDKNSLPFFNSDNCDGELLNCLIEHQKISLMEWAYLDWI